MFPKVRYGVRLAKGNPAVGGSPVRLFVRLAAWRVRSALGWGTTVAFPRYNANFYCPPEWRGMAKMAYALREYCEPELARLDQWLRQGDTVVDVGAHYGSYTIALSRLVGPQGHVFAVEPSAHALPVLRRNIEINRLTNVKVLKVGLGEIPGNAILHMHADPSRASLNNFVEGDISRESIRVVRLDDAVPSRHRIAFIKMDIEGYELPALHGARRILERDHPLVLFEFQPAAAIRAGLPAHGALDFLSQLGYRFSAVHPMTGAMTSVLPSRHVPGPNLLASFY